MKTCAYSASKAIFLVTVLIGMVGGLALAISTRPAELSEFLSRAGIGFGVAWGLAYLTMKG